MKTLHTIKYDPSYIEEYLTDDGTSITDYFVVDNHIMHLSELDGEPTPFALVIEDDELAMDCATYLKENGAKQFNSMDELNVYLNINNSS
ncbi:MAG: hypothetical protein JSV21_06895 [Nitrospirota bacterium]|nr:MAG: hypothetical protein JSV21_06895 [Nitrospirota bacterium]